MRIAVALVVVAACGGGDRMRRGWVSADRSVSIVEAGAALVAARDGTRRTFRTAADGCLRALPDYVFVAGNGELAIALSWRATGGSYVHHVEHELALACVLNLVDGSVAAMRTVYPNVEPPRSPGSVGFRIGERTRWVYEQTTDRAGALRVHDPATRAHVQLDVSYARDDSCDLVGSPGTELEFAL